MRMDDLTTLPNLGKTLVQKLIQVDIETPTELKSVGSENAFIRLKTVDYNACINMLYALEGAVQGIRWHDLDQTRKKELKEFFDHLK
jgi:DNA transformation protein and related proteins